MPTLRRRGVAISAFAACTVLLTVVVLNLDPVSSASSNEGHHAAQGELSENTLSELDIESTLPNEVVVQYQPEIDSLSLAYAPGQTSPSLAELVPTFAKSTVISSTGGEIVATSQGVQAQANGQMKAAPSDTTMTSVLQEGDVAVLTALRWQCGWMFEYANAAESGDTARTVRAEEMLKQFPKLDAIAQYAPDFIQMHDDVVEPAFSGDLIPLKDWVRLSCPKN